METYYLVYAFDKECKISKKLMEGTLEEIDRFTMNFNNSNDIRRYFKEEIEEFRDEKQEYIKKSEETLGRTESGDIVIHSIILNKNREFENIRTRVLYKYSVKIFNELVKNKELMSRFSNYSYVTRNVPYDELPVFTFSEEQASIVKFYSNRSQTAYDRVISSWKKKVKNSNKYGATIRKIFDMYKTLSSGNKNLQSFESLITSYKNKETCFEFKVCKKSGVGKTKIMRNNIEENVNFDVEDSMRDSMKDLLSAYDYTDPNMTPEELNEYYNENIPKFF